MSTHTQASSEEQRHHELVRRKLMRAVKRGRVEDAERLLVEDSDPCLLQLRPCEQPGSPLHLAVALACWGPPPSVCMLQRWCRTLGRALLPSFLSSSPHLLHRAQHLDHHPKEQQQQQGTAAAAVEDAERQQQELPSSSSSSTDGEAEDEAEEGSQQQARRSRGTSSRAAAASPAHTHTYTAGMSSSQQLLRACGRERQALVSLLLSCGCDPFVEDGEGATALDLATSRWDRRLMRHPGHLVWTQNKQACDQVLSMLQPHAYFAAQLRAQVRPFGSQDWCHVRVMLAPRRRSSSPLDLAASAGAAADNGAAGAGGDLGAAAPYTCELWMFACEPGARVLAVVPLQGAHVQAIHLPSAPPGTQPALPVPASSAGAGAAGSFAQPSQQESQRRYRALALQLPPPQQQQPGGNDDSSAGQRGGGGGGGAFRRVRGSKAEFNPSFLQPIRSSSPQATHHDTHGAHEGLGRGGYMLALKPMDPGDSFACAQFDALCALLLGGRRQLPPSSTPAANGAAPGSTRPGALDAAHIDASFRRLCRAGADTRGDPSPPPALPAAAAAAAEVASLAPAAPPAPMATPALAGPPPAGVLQHSSTRPVDDAVAKCATAAPAAAAVLPEEEEQRQSGSSVSTTSSGAGVVSASRCISAPAPPASCSSASDNTTTAPMHDPPRSRLALTAVKTQTPAAATPPTSNGSGRSSASSASVPLQRQQQQRQQLQQLSPASLLTSGWGVPHVCPDGMACGHTPLAHLFMREAAAEQQRRRAALRLPTRAQLVAHRRMQQQQHRRQHEQQRQSGEQQQQEDAGAATPVAMEISPAVSAAPVPPAASANSGGMRLFSSTWEGEATPSCVVCMDEAPSLGFRHAGTVHACVCYTCAELLVSKHQQQGCSSSGHAQGLLEPLLCPVCRQQVDEVVLV